MNARKEFDQFVSKTSLTDQEFAEFKQLVLRQARRAATIFGICAIVALITLVYAFTAQAEALKRRLMCERREAEAQSRISSLEAEIKASAARAEAARMEAERLLRASQEQSKATNSKK